MICGLSLFLRSSFCGLKSLPDSVVSVICSRSNLTPSLTVKIRENKIMTKFYFFYFISQTVTVLVNILSYYTNFSILINLLASISRSSRFFSGNCRVFDFFGHTHRGAQLFVAIVKDYSSTWVSIFVNFTNPHLFEVQHFGRFVFSISYTKRLSVTLLQ